MASPPANKIERAHQMYREGLYEEALGFYSESLSVARTKPQKIALHSNRAACYLKLHNFKKAAEECTFVLDLDHNHTGALMLRAQTLVTLKEYHSALFDVSRLMELNPSSEIYQNLESRLKTQLSLAPIPEAEAELEEEDEDKYMAKLSDKEGLEERELEESSKVMEDSVAEYRKAESEGTSFKEEIIATRTQTVEESSEQQSSGWKTIPKPKGHTHLDYSRWDRVEDDSSEEEDEDDNESQPQYRFRVKTVGVRSVK